MRTVELAAITRSDWDALTALPDAIDLRFWSRYQDWVENRERNKASLERQGFQVKYVAVQASSFSRWCSIRAKSLGVESLIEFMASRTRYLDGAGR